MSADAVVAPPLRHWPRILILALVGILALGAYTQHNTFPFTYHPDEGGKVKQIVTKKRNFHHPLLTLATTRAALRALQMDKVSKEKIAVAGRTTMAVFSAIAVVCLTLLAWRWAGWPGAGIAGFLLLADPLVFELAHYFKEDPALLFGLAVCFLAMDVYWRTPTPGSAAFLGVGCALAMSGKYIGIVALLFVIPVLIGQRKAPGHRRALAFALGFLGPLLLINFPLLQQFSVFEAGLSREMAGATAGHRGLGRDVPHLYYIKRLWETCPPGIWPALVVVGIFAVTRLNRLSRTQWMTLLFPVFFIVLLSFSPKTAGRYLLPVQTFLVFLVGTGLGAILRHALRVWRTEMAADTPNPKIKARALAGLCIGITFTTGTLYSTGTEFLVRWREFAADSRDELRHWIAENLPANAVIAQDDRINLEADPDWRARKVLSAEFVADLGDFATLRAQGVTHVAVTTQTYRRFFDESLKPTDAEKADFERRAAFYRELLDSGKPLRDYPGGKIIYLRPTMHLFALPPAP